MVYEWAQHRDVCLKMYIEDRKPLEEIMTHLRDTYNFTPSKRAYQTQFKRWGFPSKQNPAHRNADLVSRVKELWEANYTQRDMLKTLNDEGYDLKERELMRLRAKNRWLLRIPNGMKQYDIDTSELNDFQNELLVAPGVPTELAKPVPVTDPEAVDASNGDMEDVLRKRKERHDQMQADSDERYASKKRRRRTREYAGIPADPPGPPRFPSETTLEESKLILSMDLNMYRSVRDQFQAICEEEGVIKKTLAGSDKWHHVKNRLINENEHMQQVFVIDKNNLQSKELALDVIATDVTKRMRGIGRRMTIVDAKNALGLNPEQSRQVRNAFYVTLQKDKFTSKLETGPEHWQELKTKWLNETPLLKDLFSGGEDDPNYEAKQKAVEALCRDVMKRLRDDQSKRKKNPDKIPVTKVHPSRSAIVRAGPVATAAAANKALAAAAAQHPEQGAYQYSQDLSDLQIDPTLLEVAENFSEPVSAPTPVYLRPHVNSQIHQNEKMSLGSLLTPTVHELRTLLARRWPNAAFVRIDGVEKDSNGHEVSYLVEEDEELEAYLDHVKDRKAIFVVMLDKV